MQQKMIENNIWPQEVRQRLLHIFPQTIYHGDAEICGSAEALKSLGEFLIEASGAKQTESPSTKMMCADGEGYRVVARVMSDQQMTKSPLPYSTPGLPWEHEKCWDCPKRDA